MPKSLHLTIETVRIQSLIAKLENDFEPNIAGQPLQAQFLVTGQRLGRSGAAAGSIGPSPSETFVYLTSFEFKYFNTPMPGPTPFENVEQYPLAATIQADIASIYTGPLLGSMDADALNVWGIRNAVLHQWPYWRELCQSSLSRMGLPIVAVPLWNAPSVEAVTRGLKAAAEGASPSPAKAKTKRKRKV